MPEVIKIGITEKNNQKIQEVKTVKVIANQGIVGAVSYTHLRAHET